MRRRAPSTAAVRLGGHKELNVQVGVVGPDHKFRLLTPSEVEAHLRTVQ